MGTVPSWTLPTGGDSILRRSNFLCGLYTSRMPNLMVPVYQGHRKYLRFLWEGEAFQFTCLPFSLSTAPCTFTKLLRPVVASLRSRGMRMVIYLDDILLMNQSSTSLCRECQSLLDLLKNLGFLVNYNRSELTPSIHVQCMSHVPGIRAEHVHNVPTSSSEGVIDPCRNSDNLTGPCGLRAASNT